MAYYYAASFREITACVIVIFNSFIRSNFKKLQNHEYRKN